MPGCGKSTLGKKLAKHLQWTFTDLDTLIEEKEQEKIDIIFDSKGEDYFRKIEKLALRETQQLKKVVISCGGGTPVYFNNMNWMNKHGLSIYLNAPISLLINRIERSKTERPLFRTLNREELEKKICDLYNKRHPIFELAKLSIPLPVKSSKSLAHQAFEHIQS